MIKFKDIFLTTTDTIPGIGAPYTKVGENALYELKKRPREKKIIIMVGSIEQARTLKGWSQKAEELASKHWPGKTTLVLNKEIAVRMPGVPELCNLIRQKGIVYMTSANISGMPHLTIEDAIKQFPEIKEVYNFGTGSGHPSRIIRVSDGKVLR